MRSPRHNFPQQKKEKRGILHFDSKTKMVSSNAGINIFQEKIYFVKLFETFVPKLRLSRRCGLFPGVLGSDNYFQICLVMTSDSFSYK